jgi:hypothetical protein
MLKIEEAHGENSDGAATYEVRIMRNNKTLKSFYAYPLYECPEDATLSRDLHYAYSAVDFFKLGYEAGKNNEPVDYITHTIGEGEV